jgi:hypothetical protein
MGAWRRRFKMPKHVVTLIDINKTWVVLDGIVCNTCVYQLCDQISKEITNLPKLDEIPVRSHQVLDFTCLVNRSLFTLFEPCTGYPHPNEYSNMTWHWPERCTGIALKLHSASTRFEYQSGCYSLGITWFATLFLWLLGHDTENNRSFLQNSNLFTVYHI